MKERKVGLVMITKWGVAARWSLITIVLALMLIGCAGATAVQVTAGNIAAWMTPYGQQEAMRQVTYNLNLLQAAQFAIQMDQIYDRLPDPPPFEEDFPDAEPGTIWEIATNSTRAVNVVLEARGYYASEGINDEPELPSLVGFIPYDASEEFVLGGRAFCLWGTMTASNRYVNPLSPWYGDPQAYVTLIHELGHTEGICANDPDMESANVLVTDEVMASMAMRGNTYIIKPLVGDLRDNAMAYLRGSLYASGAPDWVYATFAKTLIYSTPLEQVKFDASDQYWLPAWKDRMDIIQRYGMQPYVFLQEGLGNPGYETRVLPIPGDTIKLDSLAYFLRHLSVFEALAKGGE